MAVPAAPLALLLLLLLLPTTPATPAPTASPCPALVPDNSEEQNLTNRIRGCAELDWNPFQQHRRVLLRHNGIEALSPSARLGPGTEVLDLAENRLRELPEGFFSNATALRSLCLEGNPLRAVPAAAFQPSLRSLSVSCRCDVLRSVLAPCARPGLSCLCFTAQRRPFNATDFHGRQCGPGAGPVAAAAAAAVAAGAALAAAGAVLWHRRLRAAAAMGRGKQDPAGNVRQPRYISRESTGTGSGTGGGTEAPDYENVFVSPGRAAAAAQGWAQGRQEQRYSPQVLVDEDYFLQSSADPGEQPIYANTLGLTEDIYIIPDQ